MSSSTHSHICAHTQSGLLAVWKVESTGQIQPVPMHQHRLLSLVTHLEMLHPLAEVNSSRVRSVLDTFSWQRKNAAHLAETVKDPIACFFVTQEGECVWPMWAVSCCVPVVPGTSACRGGTTSMLDSSVSGSCF